MKSPTLATTNPTIWQKPGARWASDFADDLLMKLTCEGGRHILSLDAGTGKTNTFGQVFDKFTNREGLARRLHRMTGKAVIIVSPTNALGNQLAAVGNLPFIKGGTKAAMIRRAIDFGTLITNAASLRRVLNFVDIRDCYLIADEVQSIINDAYKDQDEAKQMQYLYHAMFAAYSSLGISATPYPFFETDGFAYIAPQLRNPQHTNLTIKRCEGNTLPYLIKHLTDADLSQGKVVIRTNSHRAGRVIQQHLEGILPEGRRVAIVNAKNKASADTVHLEKRESIPNDVAALIMTEVGDAGLNFNDLDIREIIYAQAGTETVSPETLKQIFARPRKLDTVPAVAFIRNRKAVKPTPDWREVVARKKEAAKVQAELHNLAERGKRLAAQLEAEGMSAPSFAGLPAPDYCIRNEFTGQYQADHLRIYREALAARNEALTIEGLADELRGIMNAEITIIDAEKCDDEGSLQAVAQAEQVREVAADAELFEMLEADLPGVLAAAANLDNDKVKYKALRAAEKLGLPTKDYDEALRDKLADLGSTFRPLGYFATMASHQHHPQLIFKFFRHLGKIWKHEAKRIISEAKEREQGSTNPDFWRGRWEHKHNMLVACEGRPYFDGNIFRDASAELEAARLLFLNAGAKRRETMTTREKFTAEGYCQFRDDLRKSKGRELSKETIGSAYAKAFPTFANDPSAAQERGLELASLLMTLQHTRSGRQHRWKVICAKKSAQIFEKYGFAEADILPQKPLLERLRGYFSAVADEGAEVGTSTVYKSTTTSNNSAQPTSDKHTPELMGRAQWEEHLRAAQMMPEVKTA